MAKAASDGMPGLGITDHGNMYGVLDFYRACKDQDIKPIIGCELYQADDSATSARAARQDGRLGGSTDGGKKLYYHLIALAENNTGYKNLIQLLAGPSWRATTTSPGSTGRCCPTTARGHRHHRLPRRPRAAVADERQRAGALEKAARMQDIFGRDNLFVELQDHGIPAQHETNPKLLEIAARSRRRSSSPTTPTTPSSTTTPPTTRCCACRPGR